MMFRLNTLDVDSSTKELAPRTRLEPATKRLTAAHSTIELPGNEYLNATAQIR